MIDEKCPIIVFVLLIAGEIRYDVYPSIQTNEILPHPGRIRRQATSDQDEEEYDIELDFVPPVSNFLMSLLIFCKFRSSYFFTKN